MNLYDSKDHNGDEGGAVYQTVIEHPSRYNGSLQYEENSYLKQNGVISLLKY